MSTASLIVAICGLTLSCLSLGWQAANFVLTGGRVKVTLRVGALGTGGLMHSAPESIGQGWWEELAAKGFTRPVVAVNVANVGRQPVTIERWGLRGAIASYYPLEHVAGPKLPHRLEVGQAVMWAADYEAARNLVDAGREVLRQRQTPTALLARVRHQRSLNRGARAVVDLASGKAKKSRDEVR